MKKMEKNDTHSGRMEAQLSQWGAKLDELQATGGERWETFKVDLDKAWSEVEAAFKKLAEPVTAAAATPMAEPSAVTPAMTPALKPMVHAGARTKKHTEAGPATPPRV